MSTSAAMVTARVSADTKDRAAANLLLAGYSPSQAVQILWQYFAEQDVAQTAALMRTVSGCDADDMTERRRKVAQLESSIISPDAFEDALGIRIPEGFAGLSREELEEHRYQELMSKYCGGDLQ